MAERDAQVVSPAAARTEAAQKTIGASVATAIATVALRSGPNASTG